MIDKRILFIDDDPSTLKEQAELILPKLNAMGINAEHDILNVREERFLDQSRNLDSVKVVDFVSDTYFSTKYAVVACDLSFVGGGEVAGYYLLKKIINKARQEHAAIRYAEFVFYSAQTDKLGKEVFEKSELQKLIRLRIAEIFQRERVFSGIADFIKKQKK